MGVIETVLVFFDKQVVPAESIFAAGASRQCLSHNEASRDDGEDEGDETEPVQDVCS